MSILIFVILAALYILALAAVDGLFNRLIFRSIMQYPYESPEKKEIYKLVEWRYIGLVFLIFLPVVIPTIAAFLIGGVRYVFIYIAILLFIQWDMIFGKLVFGRWFGDTPSIALPKIGWVSLSIYKTVAIRLILFMVVVWLFVSVI